MMTKIYEKTEFEALDREIKNLRYELEKLRNEHKGLVEEFVALKREVHCIKTGEPNVQIKYDLGYYNRADGWTPLDDFAQHCLMEICNDRENAGIDPKEPVLLISNDEEFTKCLNDAIKEKRYPLEKYDLTSLKVVPQAKGSNKYHVVAVFSRDDEIENYVKYCVDGGLLLDFGEDPNLYAVET